MKVYRYNQTTHTREEIINIMEGTYTGKMMGERSITATIEFPSRIDFQIGDFVEFDIANLLRGNGVEGGHDLEKFYIYTMPTVKKVARRLSNEKAFQHTVTFYPCQYELATVKMRDLIQEQSSGIIYTGYDEFSFYGGANTLMKRIMAVLNERFGTSGVPGKDYWTYYIADGVNEDKNTSLEKFQFDFSNNSVMEALLKLNEADGINTKFFINERTIYVGYKCPYITGVDEHNIQRTYPFEFKYGKTSHLPDNTNHGNLFTITKSNGQASPITRLYAYGSDRNLHRFYCADRIKSGRYINKLMLPSFGDDGRTDYIDSEEGILRFGIREGSKTFDKVYPSLRNFYYGNIRDIKYCIKIMGSGLESDADGVYDSGMTIVKSSVAKEQLERVQSQITGSADSITLVYGGKEVSMTRAQANKLMQDGSVSLYNSQSGSSTYQYPIARIQCYRVDELLDSNNNHTGLNKLTPCAPPVDLAVFCHSTGKVVKCVLYSNKNGQTSVQRQLAADGKVPTRTYGGNDYIVGSCFAVHDDGYVCGHQHIKKSYPGLPDCDQRAAWFTDQDQISIYTDGVVDPDKEIYRNQVSIHQIHYTDDHWITDVFEFVDYEQQTFNRQGYSAYCWPRVNKYYPESKSDNVEVSSVVAVGPVYIEDTDLNLSEGQSQATFDLYLRDVGFKINEQTWFGDFVFIFDTPHINFLDGNLAGYSFELPKESDQNSTGTIYVPALLPDGTENAEFFDMADNPAQARAAYNAGAFWRVVAKRSETGITNYWMPNVNINAKAGDHIVFLDIFMPDIYIRVAEQRLQKEAQKYLDANDDGDIQYSFDFDKVRPNQQPIFALQMREGAIMRVVDDDLDISTINDQKTLFDDKDGLVSARSMLKQTTSVDTNIEIVNRDCDYIEANEIEPAQYGTTESDGVTRHYLRFKKSAEDSSVPFDLESGVSIRLYSPAKTQRTQGGGIEVLEWYVWNYVAFPSEIVADNGYYRAYIDNLLSLDSHAANIANSNSKVYVGYSLRATTVTSNYDESILPVGSQRFCAANNITEFKPNKYYEIIMDAMESDLVVADSNGVRRMFMLVNGLGDGEVFFRPEYTATVIAQSGQVTRYKFAFKLDDSFNSSIDYYPAIVYQSDGQTEAVHVRLWNIIERDDEALEDLSYVDLAIDTVTIKFHDNTREKNVSLQDGLEPERISDNPTAMIREIQATVKEESRASAWAQLMDRVAETEIVEQQNTNFYQSMVNAARMHYLELLNLKNNIFDPDGTCNEVFLQTMMLQVGADSMNYQLKYTYYNANGKRQNCDLVPGSSPATGSPDKFVIGNAEDRLDHFVYTDNPTNGEGGTWFLRPGQGEGYEWNLIGEIGEDNAIVWPTYFISIKCSRSDPRVAWWKCETTQRKVNEDDNFFYFNWGILSPDSDGHYTLTETRGNAYMYGDNLICGRISTLARDSYFDLTHGDFVLSKNGAPALAYVNGTLTIYGVNDNAADSLISRLNGAEGDINTIKNTTIPNVEGYIATVQQTLQNQIDGVVDSYFMEGAPTLNNAPANDWKVYDEHGDLNPTETAKEYARHEGDTYTNIQNYQKLGSSVWEQGGIELESTNIGLPIVELDDKPKRLRTKSYITYKAGDTLDFGTLPASLFLIKVAYLGEENSQIVVKEIQGFTSGNALKDTYTMCAVQITPKYESSAGNADPAWAETYGFCVNPTAGHSWRFCKGTGENPATWHWHEIADSDAVKALQDAAKAQAAADGKMRFFTSTTAHPTPYPPYQVGDMWAKSVGETGKTEVLYSTQNRTDSYVATDWVSASEYAEYLADQAHGAAAAAQQAAEDAMDKANDIANDGIISGGTEKGTLKKEFVEIAGEDYGNNNTSPLRTDGSYRKALAQATEYGLSSDAKVTALTSAYTTLRNAMKIVLGTNEGGYIDCSNLNNDTYVGADYDYGGETGIESRYDITFGGRSYDKDEFIALWKNYYDAEIALLNLVSDTIDAKEVGGENLYGDADPLTISGRKNTSIVLETGKKYVITIGRIEGNATNLKLQDKNGSTYTDYVLITSGAGGNPITPITNYKVVVTGKGGTLTVACSLQSSSHTFTLTQIMVQKGEKPTSYQNSYKYLAEAFMHDATKQTTDIAGGLIASSLVLLRNQNNQVRAGISGLDDDGKKIQNGALVVDANSHGVGFFAGGTYAEALAAAAGNGDIPVLLTKDGILSRIGCFRVVNKDTIAVVTGESTIYITNKDIYDVAIIQDSDSEYMDALIHVDDGDASQSGSDSVVSSITFNVAKSGKYNIIVPQTAISAESGVLSYPATPGVYPGQSDAGDASATAYGTFYIRIKNNGTVIHTSSSARVETENFTDDGQARWWTESDNASIASINITKEIAAGSIVVEIVGSYSVSASATTDTSVHAAGDARAEISFDIGDVDIVGVEKYCVVAKDGMAIIANSNASFYVRNSQNTLQLLAKGLPTSDPNVKGQLYAKNDDHILRVSAG